MAIRGFKPTTPSRRAMTMATFEEITTDKPEKSLLAPKKRQAGRNAQGKITVRHRGGGHKKNYRIIDFKRNNEEKLAREKRSASEAKDVTFPSHISSSRESNASTIAIARCVTDARISPQE